MFSFDKAVLDWARHVRLLAVIIILHMWFCTLVSKY